VRPLIAQVLRRLHRLKNQERENMNFRVFNRFKKNVAKAKKLIL